MSTIPISQVNLIAVGVENYQYMRSLRGPKKDVERIVDLMVHSPETGIYNLSQVNALINPDSNTLRSVINDYVINRSAQDDILIFYFSGHGIPIGFSDFGFCTSDARIHNVTGAILPLTVLSFRDLINSLRVMSITPVMIIDSCYSGMLGSVINISSFDAIKNMQQEISRQNASNYALLCSCSDQQISTGDKNGGVFSQIFFDILSKGLKSRSSEKIIYLQDIFPEIKMRALSEIADSTPQLFLGETISSIPLVRNTTFIQPRYHFYGYMAAIIVSLWNDGNERELSKEEILSFIGRGAYGNHRKLSYIGWDLLEDNPKNGKRRLTEKGREFAQGKLLIPDEVSYNSNINDYNASPESNFIDIYFFAKPKIKSKF